MDRKIEMASEIKHLIEESIAEGSDSWFLNAEINHVAPTDYQQDEHGLGLRFKDGKTYAITIRQLDDAVV